MGESNIVQLYEQSLHKDSVIACEVGEIPTMSQHLQIQSADETVAQTTAFLDQDSGSTTIIGDVEPNGILADEATGATLGEFLSRPVLINTYSWLEATGFGVKSSFNPWHLFFNSVPIKKKLDNFAFINCKLHLKIVINASPFYYGSMAYTYRPLASITDDMIQTDSGGGQLIGYSQRPAIWLYPQVNEGGEMELPFFYHKNWVAITSANDLISMGTITPIIYNQLQSANGATGTGVTVQTYAWATDVKLMGPTISLAVQTADEYGVGSISRPASAIAAALGLLGQIPVIGPFMTASSIVASGVGRIASLFGYTNVPVIADVVPMRNIQFPHLASSDIGEPIEKLALDPKTELTIDPKTLGIKGDDELDIGYLCSKESFITSFLLNTTDSVDTLVFASLVHPFQFYRFANTSTWPVQTIPCGYVQNLFKYWRGDIVYRFKFICTQYHKGRVRVTYDPVGPISTTIPDYSTTFNQVVDIGAENDFEVVVPYMQALAWSKCLTDVTTPTFSIVGGVTHVEGTTNGTLTMRIVTPLSCPLSTGNVPVQVWVRAAKNFELAYPVDPPTATVLTLQAADEVDFDQPEQCIAGHSAGHSAPERYLLNFGEAIKSLRQVLRRSTLSEVYTSIPTSSGSLYTETTSNSDMGRYPKYFGYDTNAQYSGAGTVIPATNYPFNYVKVTPYNWIAPMFIGQRGSMNWHFNLNQSPTVTGNGSLTVCRTGTVFNSYNNVNNVLFSNTVSYNAWLDSLVNDTGSAGVSLTNLFNQSNLSVVMVNYTPNRFQFVSPSKINKGQTIDGSDLENHRLTVKTSAATGSSRYPKVAKYAAIGVDYNLYFFLNVPSYFLIAVPTPN